jgi:uncharacterized protein
MDRKEQLDNELRRLVPILKDRFNATLIVLFGSSATGTVSDWSDLDLVVVRETPLRFLDRIGELLVAIKPNIGVDFLVYTPQEWQSMSQSNRFVREEILGKGKVLYAA